MRQHSKFKIFDVRVHKVTIPKILINSGKINTETQLGLIWGDTVNNEKYNLKTLKVLFSSKYWMNGN